MPNGLQLHDPPPKKIESEIPYLLLAFVLVGLDPLLFFVKISVSLIFPNFILLCSNDVRS